MRTDDTELLRRSANRSDRERLLADLFQRHRPRLRLMVTLRLDERLQRRVDPSDVIQDAYIDACHRLEDYLRSPALPLFVWLRRLTAQRLVDLHRFHLGAQARDARRELHQNPAPEASSFLLAARLLGRQPTPSEVAARSEKERMVREALDTMEPIDREVLTLRHFEQLSNDEAATVLGISASAASKRHARALRHLQNVLPRGYGQVEETTNGL